MEMHRNYFVGMYTFNEPILWPSFTDTTSDVTKNILVIDDDMDFHNLLKSKLGRVPYDIDFVADSYHAFNILKAKKPDLILMDIYMPGINGVQLAQILDHSTEFRDIPIIFLTADREMNTRMLNEVQTRNAINYKPINTNKLKRTIYNFLY